MREKRAEVCVYVRLREYATGEPRGLVVLAVTFAADVGNGY